MDPEMNQEMINTKALFSIGDIVKVKYNIDKTKNSFTASHQMKKMRMESKIEIGNILWSDNHSCPSIYAGGWQWHPDDLFVIKHKNPGKLNVGDQQNSFMFDPKDL